MSKGEPSVQQFCEQILDLLGEGIYVSDRHGRTLTVNKMYERLTGLKKSDLVGQNVDVLVGRGFDTVVNPRVVKTGKPVTSVQTDGQGNKRVLNGYPIFDAAGQVDLVVTFVRDVTLLSQFKEQIAAQRQLIERYRSNVKYINEERGKKYPIITVCQALNDLLARMINVAGTDATVLLQGETGVGKDVFAHRIHQASPRSERPFFKVDCPTIPETLIESELFGYAPGAFSGARAKGKIGFFEIADRGTIFLDEIGELPLAMQAKLLRVLQDCEILPVGSTKVRRVDTRIVAATNRDLEEEVRQGRFRSDLFYRLRVAVFTIPPLRDRKEDILPLARHFLELYNTRYRKNVRLSGNTEQVLQGHHWPGNVRELEHLMQSLVIGCQTEQIEPGDLPSTMVGAIVNLCRDATLEVVARSTSLETDRSAALQNLYQAFGGEKRSLKEIMAEIEGAILEGAIKVHGSIGEVAKKLDVDRSTLFRKLRRSRRTSSDDLQ